MAKRAKKKSAVSRAVRTVKKAATSTARSTSKSREKDDARGGRPRNLPGANPNN